MISISICKTPREWREFEDVAELLHGRHPSFVPPFPDSIAKFLSPKSAFHRRHGKIIPIIARRDGQAVGRIAAIINQTHNAYYKDQTGFFGFFECEENADTAQALFTEAAATLFREGMVSIRGPYNPSINDECGLLTENFNMPPFLGLTWNPSYYEKLVLANEFEEVRKMFGYWLPLHRLQVPERLQKIANRAATRASMKLRPIKLPELEKELEIIHEVYNDTLERNWGFIPITMDDLLSAAEDLKAIADPGMILIAECKGENAGVALSLPNINDILIKLKRTPKWLRPLHFLWLQKTTKRNTGRQVVYGISPRFRDKGGLHAWLLLEQFTSAKARFENAELGWIEETNLEIMENVKMLGAEQHKTWKIYEKSLTNWGNQ